LVRDVLGVKGESQDATETVNEKSGVSKKIRRAFWGGIISFVCGTLLLLFGALILSAFVHDNTKTILIPAGLGVAICSLVAMLGGMAATDRKNYRLALLGSILPSTIFLTAFALSPDGMPFLAIPGLMGIPGAVLMILARHEFPLNTVRAAEIT
jgi:hypothetical protein